MIVLHCMFHPQVWINDHACECDPEGEVLFVALSETVPDDDSYESDELRFADDAPQWIKDWSGPFWVEINNREDITG